MHVGGMVVSVPPPYRNIISQASKSTVSTNMFRCIHTSCIPPTYLGTGTDPWVDRYVRNLSGVWLGVWGRKIWVRRYLSSGELSGIEHIWQASLVALLAGIRHQSQPMEYRVSKWWVTLQGGIDVAVPLTRNTETSSCWGIRNYYPERR